MDIMTCGCKDFLRWRGLCRDIWHKHLYGDQQLTDDQFKRLADRLEGGYFVYYEAWDNPVVDGAWRAEEEERT